MDILLCLYTLCSLVAVTAGSVYDGIEHHNRGDFDGAAAAYDAVLQLRPLDSDALHLRGMALLGKARSPGNLPDDRRRLLADADAFVTKALGQLDPDSAHRLTVLCNLGLIQRAQGDYVAAQSTLRNVMSTAGSNTDAAVISRHNLAAVLQDMAHEDSGIADLQERQRLTEYAEALLLEVISIESGYIPAYRELGLIHKRARDHAEALTFFEAGLRLDPSDDRLLLEVALSHHYLGDVKEARRLYEELLARNPDNAEAARNLAAALQSTGDAEGAVKLYEGLLRRRAWDVDEDRESYGAVLNNLGAALVALQRHDEGYARLQECLQLEPDHVEALLNAGAYLQEEGLLEDARLAYERAEALRPGQGIALRVALMLPPVPKSEEHAITSRAAMAAAVSTLSARTDKWLPDPPAAVERIQFYLPYLGLNDRPMQEALAKMYLEAAPNLISLAPHLAAPSGDAGVAANKSEEERELPLRVGFVSKYFGDAEPHGLLLQGVVQHLPRRLFHVVLCPITAPGKRVAPALASAADEVVPLGLRRPDALETLAALKLDILVFADVNSEPISHFLAYARMAPVQAAFWGNPLTTGNPSIDYFVSGDRMEHPDRTSLSEFEDEYSEQVVLLSGQGVWYDPPELPAELAFAQNWEELDSARATLRRGLLQRLGLCGGSGQGSSGSRPTSCAGGEDSVVLYLCPQSLFKLHPRYDFVVGEVLARAGRNAYVVFTEGRRRRWTEAFQERLARALPAELYSRMRFVPRSGGGAPFLRLLASADVVLHPFPFGGSRTSAEALAVASPLVALRTMQLRGRMAGALCDTLELETFPLPQERTADEAAEWSPSERLRCVVEDEAAYVELAVKLGKEAPLRRRYSRAIYARAPRLWGRREVVYEWARFLAMAGGVEPPRPEEVGLKEKPDSDRTSPVSRAVAGVLGDSSARLAAREVLPNAVPNEQQKSSREAGSRRDGLAAVAARFNAAYASGDLVQAEEAGRLALQLRPDDPGVLNDLGAVLHQQWRLDEAAELFQRAAAAAPGHAAALGNLGVVRAAQGRVHEAEECYRAALIAEPASAEAESPSFLNLASLLRDSGRLEEAVELLTDTMALPPLGQGGAFAAALALFEERSYHRDAVEAIAARNSWAPGLWNHVRRLRETFLLSANELTVWLSWLGRLPDVAAAVLAIAGAEQSLSPATEARLLPHHLRPPADAASGRSGVHVIIQRYWPDDKRRQREMDLCLRQNLANPYIAAIHVLSEVPAAAAGESAAAIGYPLKPPPPDVLAVELGEDLDLQRAWETGRLRIAALGRRMTFEDAFDYSERHLRGQVVAVANADVFFDHSLARLGDARTLDLGGRVYALRRWESTLDGNATAEIGLAFVPRIDSQDAWLFRAPLPAGVGAKARFALGLPRCDNRLAAVLVEAGLAVTSPSLGIVVHHVDSRDDAGGRSAAANASAAAGNASAELEMSKAYPGEAQVAGRGHFVPLTDQWLW